MNIQELIKLLETRVIELNQQKATHVGLGDVSSVLRIETELGETVTTLASLKALQSND